MLTAIRELPPLEGCETIEESIIAVLDSMQEDGMLWTNIHIDSHIVEGNGYISISIPLPYTTVLAIYDKEIKAELGDNYKEEDIKSNNAQETFVYTFRVKDEKLQINMADLRIQNPRLKQPLLSGFKLFTQSEDKVDLYQFIRGGLLTTYPYSILRYRYDLECRGHHGTGDWYDIDDNRTICFSIVYHQFNEVEHSLSNVILSTIN